MCSSCQAEQSLNHLVNDTSRAVFELIAPNGHSPSQSAQRRELSIILADALAELAADHREVVVLRTLEGRDWEDVAHTMGRSPVLCDCFWAWGTQEVTAFDRAEAMNGPWSLVVAIHN